MAEINDYFSDEELAQAKETFKKSDRIHSLIRRLEAAEALIEKALSTHQYDLGWRTFWDGEVKAWRKAAGK